LLYFFYTNKKWTHKIFTLPLVLCIQRKVELTKFDAFDPNFKLDISIFVDPTFSYA